MVKKYIKCKRKLVSISGNSWGFNVTKLLPKPKKESNQKYNLLIWKGDDDAPPNIKYLNLVDGERLKKRRKKINNIKSTAFQTTIGKFAQMRGLNEDNLMTEKNQAVYMMIHELLQQTFRIDDIEKLAKERFLDTEDAEDLKKQLKKGEIDDEDMVFELAENIKKSDPEINKLRLKISIMKDKIETITKEIKDIALNAQVVLDDKLQTSDEGVKEMEEYEERMQQLTQIKGRLNQRKEEMEQLTKKLVGKQINFEDRIKDEVKKIFGDFDDIVYDASLYDFKEGITEEMIKEHDENSRRLVLSGDR